VSQPEGSCDPAFTAVRDVFAASLAAGDDLGAGLAVEVDGRRVVDLWGGVADARTGRAWERDTECVTFSATKAVTATAALLLVERGAVDLGRRVTDWWPEFGAHGKETATGEHLLTHQAGLPAFDRPVTPAEAADPVAMADQLAGQTPEWVPGTDHGYHAVTFGWLAGELVRRAAGEPLADFVGREFGLSIGVGAERVPELARISAGAALRMPERRAPGSVLHAVGAASTDPTSAMSRSMGNPAGSFNDPVVLTAGWPAAGLVCTARELAGFYGRLVAGRLLRRDTVQDAVRTRVAGPDRTLVMDSAFGLGFMRPSQVLFLPEGARRSAFGHPGASGALGLGDLDCGLAIGYVPNLFRAMSGDPRGYRIVEAVYSSL